MRRTLTACRTGLAVAAAGVLLTACGGSGDDELVVVGSSETSRAPRRAAPPADSEFCTEAAAIQERVELHARRAARTDRLPARPCSRPRRRSARSSRRRRSPTDWAAFADGIEQIAAAIAEVDVDDPAAAETFQQEVAQLQQELCRRRDQRVGLPPRGVRPRRRPGEPAAPTS